ncbi:MAG: biotin/lipoyl-containing protein, partial [Vulcanimicrobiaceae bacterium]
GYAQETILFRGHAIEVRVNAEDPAENFRPTPGTLTQYREPSGLGVRVDSAATLGATITSDYDSMIAKLIVWAPTRDYALARLRRAIDDYAIGGVTTTLPFLRALSDQPPVLDTSYGTATLEEFASRYRPPAGIDAASVEPASSSTGDLVRVEVNDRLFLVRLLDRPPTAASRTALLKPGAARIVPKRASATGNEIRTPMHGLVVELRVADGAAVEQGQVVAIVEAMKMMNEIRAHRAGTVTKLHVAAGATVEANAPLVTLAEA